ncbi:MAG: hypothetical protein QIT35_gp76 [Methanophagales virus PBV299]|uniref:Uncharacterized protein n=1 Tax=Methanophagales virus PBV299 TaxID=2987730 RepID=A0ABY6GN70_9CAUD|nr:MAG: hypothetical protein QIT35_gp76 [Methanophagales virus PBV299]UYL64872.1 MAG: hypothetical protein OFDIEDLO_00076 [Methanophagales virus PBV299]
MEKCVINKGIPTSYSRSWDKEWTEEDNCYKVHIKTKGVEHVCANTAIENRITEKTKSIKSLPFGLPMITLSKHDEPRIVEQDNVVAFYLPVVHEREEFYSYFKETQLDYEILKGEVIADIEVEAYEHNWFRDHDVGSRKQSTRVLVFRKGVVQIKQIYRWRDDTAKLNPILYENEEGEVETYYPDSEGEEITIINHPATE